MRENRIIGLIISDLNKQRSVVGSQPVTSASSSGVPSGSNSYSVKSNIQDQNSIRQASSSALAAIHPSLYYGNDVATNTQGSGIRDSSGKVINPTAGLNNTGIGMTDNQVNQMQLSQDNTDQAKTDADRQGFTGSNTAYDPSVEQQRKNILDNTSVYSVDAKGGHVVDEHATALEKARIQSLFAQQDAAALLQRQTNNGQTPAQNPLMGNQNPQNQQGTTTSIPSSPILTPGGNPSTFTNNQTDQNQGGPQSTQQQSNPGGTGGGGAGETGKVANGSGNSSGGTGQTDQNGNQVDQNGIPVQQNSPQDFALLGVPPFLQQAIAGILKNIPVREGQANTQLLNTDNLINMEQQNANYFAQKGQDLALSGLNRQLDLASRTRDVNALYAQETQRKTLAEIQNNQAMFQAQETHALFQQEQQNIQQEKENRLILGKTGGNMDTNGLDWLHTQTARGQEAVNFMMQTAALQNAKFGNDSIASINKFGNDMRAISTDYQNDYDKAFGDYNSTISDITKNRMSTGVQIIKDKQQANKDYLDALDKIDTKKGDAIKNLTEMYTSSTRIQMEKQNHQDMVDLRKDTIDISQGQLSVSQFNAAKQQRDIITTRTQHSLENDPVIKAYTDGSSLKSTFDTASQMYDSAQNDEQRGAASTQMAIQFSHYQNAGSIRIQDLGIQDMVKYQSFVDKWKGQIYSSINGGPPLPKEGIEALQSLMELTDKARQKQALTAARGFLMTVNGTNSILARQGFGADSANDLTVHPSDFSVPGLSLPTDWMNKAQTNYGKKISAPDGAFSPSAMRTDRNNNPTALQWTPGVEKFFNDKGYEVSKGDIWPNGKNYTLDMTKIKDPVGATVAYINDYSFFHDGQPRWTHTAMPQDKWNALSDEEKRNVVGQMYKKEGGNGSLFAQLPSNNS